MILEVIFLEIPDNKFRVSIFLTFLHSPSPCWDLKAKVDIGLQEYHFRVDSRGKEGPVGDRVILNGRPFIITVL